MFKCEVTKFEVMVAGYSGSGKANFINRFLHNFPSSAEVCRKSGVTYFTFIPDININIQLHDVSDIEKIDRKCYDKMDLVFLFYAANDTRTFEPLEKCIDLLRAEVEKEELHSSPLRTKKEVNLYLVADLSNLENQQDVSECLCQKAKKLQETFGIRFIESSFQDEESASSSFQTILEEVINPKIVEKISKSDQRGTPEKCVESVFTDSFPCELSKYVDKLSELELSDFGDIDEKNLDYFVIQRAVKTMSNVLVDKSLSSEEKINKLRSSNFEKFSTYL